MSRKPKTNREWAEFYAGAAVRLEILASIFGFLLVLSLAANAALIHEVVTR